MTEKKQALAISDASRTKLEALERALVEALGDDLVSFIVHGSAVRGGWREAESDIDVVVVLREAQRAKLEAIANPLMIARYSSRIEAMILTASEIPRAADVFPVFYDDIRREHVVLHGSDPFATLTIATQHLRLRVEQELREAQIRLRRVVTDGFGSKASLGGAVVRKVRQIRAPLRALLGLKGVESGDDLDSVLGKACSAYGVDAAPLLDVTKNAEAAHAALVALLDAAIEEVDRMESAT